ncbi:hypothetical protein J506_0705 [Acinetobacter baumannii 625974]|uniref:Uncharacterized protein n=1 Tax=Acinetobacter baumannii 625974 TaxID=1310607 RepID=A0A009PJK3_ACIBA|nr:hypothetical protein [Acinetobacter baumannii]EXC04131.1 hypothetical protein J506_3954 [Acinetobacter baumannii 625974]EXC04383.1 hypothetical protein J506_3858 [Acinetobacter baumannii 625974]EXC09371.1 hypothetical protein J506_0705 [Acinetobacter baumannii 625974]
MTDLNKEREVLEAQIEAFKKDCMELWFVPDLADSYTNTNLFDYVIMKDGVFFMKEQARQLWDFWNKAKAQAVPEGFKIVPIELSEEIAERLALERVQKPRPENDPVWVEIAERAYKSNLLAKKWELVREYKILTEASESGADG